MRTVAWFSAGAASAVAAHLTPEAVVAYIDPGSEHPDNQRFLDDCEPWLGRKIVRLRSDRYSDTWEVWERTRFLVSPYGARCTTELKKRVRQEFQRPDDLHVFGFTADEPHRAERFQEQNPEVRVRFPLIERGLDKASCMELVIRAGIDLPAMYLLGYRNANCIGCVKGGAGYWNKIRRDFPATFDRMARLERELGVSVLGDVYLDELDPQRGRLEPIAPACSIFC